MCLSTYHVGTITLVNEHLIVSMGLGGDAIHFELIVFIAGPSNL